MRKECRAAFTMIELVFVIVVIGILASIAIPRLAGTRDDAQITKGRSDVAAIRSAIVSERQGRLLQGNSAFIAALDDANYDAGQELFDGNATTLLQYPIISANGNGHWMKTGAASYTFTAMGTSVTFNYTQANGTFTCGRTTGSTAQQTLCRQLID